MLKKIVDHRWFALADLACVSAGLGWLRLSGSPAWAFLPVALLPWLMRILAGRLPFRRTRVDLLMLLFLLTAALGASISYDPSAAWKKFYLLAGGVLLFYALAGQPQDNRWPVVWFLNFIVTGHALFYLLARDWHVSPSRIDLLNQAGSWWMRLWPARPDQILPNNAGDITAGLLCMLAPFLIALGLQAWKEKRVLSGIAVLVTAAIAGVGLLATISWDGLVSLIVGALTCVAVAAAGRPTAGLWRWRMPILIAALAALTLLAVGIANPALAGTWLAPALVYARYLIGGRLVPALGAIQLLGDFPFSGGGLSSFSGLYSNYVLGVPFFYSANSHNFYLDVGLEQGFLGLLALTGIYFVGARKAFKGIAKTIRSPLGYPLIAALVILLIYGLAEDVVYDIYSAELLFFLPGLAWALPEPQSPASSSPHSQERVNHARRLWFAVLAAGAVLGLLATVNFRYLAANWYANLASIEMARIELVDFPTNRWDEGVQVERYASVERLYQRALQLDPDLRTANHRLGLLAMLRRDFPAAVVYLEKAYRVDPGHHGILKSLAYSYVWSGQVQKALPLLSRMWEAKTELDEYSRWWIAQGREDLSHAAAEAYQLLSASSPATPASPDR